MMALHCVKLFNIESKCFQSRNFAICKSIGSDFKIGKALHITTPKHFPQAIALKLPTNVVDINSAETGRFSPHRERDLAGPVIFAHGLKTPDAYSQIDVTLVADDHVGSYDCRGAVNLSASMQSNVPSPFSGNHSHLGMPGSQWGQGYKYLSDHLHSSHYLTMRNEYRGLHRLASQAVFSGQSSRKMSSEDNNTKPQLSTKEKLRKAVTEYGTTVIVFHVTISLMSLGTCYLLVSSGVDITAVLKYFNMGDGTFSKTAASNAGTFVIAYAVHKVFAPARMAITLTSTPFIVRYLRNIGFLKQPVKH